MSRSGFLCAVTSVCIFYVSSVFSAAVDKGVVPDQYIVQLKKGSIVADAASDIARQHTVEVGHLYQHALQGFSATVPAARLAALRSDPRVLSVSKVYYVSINKPCSTPPCDKPGGTEPPPPPAQTLPTGIRRINGHLSSTVSGDGTGMVDVNVAVIDSGIQRDHPDLNVVGGINCSTGKPDKYDDGNGHGTHVAGTIGALDNNIGVVGVAPGAKLWAVRVLNNSGSGTTADVVCGIDFVTANVATIKVANMSLGGPAPASDCAFMRNNPSQVTDPMHLAICNSIDAGVTYIVAAGNESQDSSNSVPASYSEVITVSALADFDGVRGSLGSPTCRVDEDDTLANFSNYGAGVDIIAPGVCILSTWINSGYNTISGTSMATPHVTGAAALYLSRNPGASPAQVRTAILSATNNDWDASDDKDAVKEPMLDVSGL